jgi:hypothetical protein
MDSAFLRSKIANCFFRYSDNGASVAPPTNWAYVRRSLLDIVWSAIKPWVHWLLSPLILVVYWLLQPFPGKF